MGEMEHTVDLGTGEVEHTVANLFDDKDKTLDMSLESENEPDLEKEKEKQSDLDEEELKEKTVQEEESFEKRARDLINDSHYFRYVAEMRRADSDLAISKAESAELVRQMDRFKKHYAEYEKYIRKLIRENQALTTRNQKRLYNLSIDIKNNSESLSSRIDREIMRLTGELKQTIETDVKASCNQELGKVDEATHVLYDYSEKVKQQYIKFQTLEKVKFGLFIVSSVSSPIVLILLILSYFHII